MSSGVLVRRVSATTLTAARWWPVGAPAPAALARWFTGAELSALSPGPGRGARVAARLAAKAAIRSALCEAGLREPWLPVLADVGVWSEAGGRPRVSLPAPALEWLELRGWRLGVSWAHERRRVLAVAAVAR